MNHINEIEINNLLKSMINNQKVGEHLINKFNSVLLDPSSQQIIANYFVHSGQYQFLYEFIQSRFEQFDFQCFSSLAEMIAHCKLPLKEEVLDALFQGAQKSEAIEELIKSNGLTQYDSRFQALRNQLIERLGMELDHQKEMLKEKLRYLSAQRLVEEEKKVLQQLLKISPEDEELKKQQLEFENRWARSVLNQGLNYNLDEEDVFSKPIEFTKVELDLIKVWKDQAETNIKISPLSTINYVYFFIFIEAWDEVHSLLENMSDSIERDWLLVQTLIIKRRFVEVLTLLQKIEISYSSDPETPFATNYYRAQAMIGLGQKEQAIVILQSLLNVRPNYRSTKSILNSLSRGHGFR